MGAYEVEHHAEAVLKPSAKEDHEEDGKKSSGDERYGFVGEVSRVVISRESGDGIDGTLHDGEGGRERSQRERDGNHNTRGSC